MSATTSPSSLARHDQHLHPGLERYHLLILRRGDAEVLLSPDRSGDRLPVIAIPRMQRAVPHLLSAVGESFGLRAVARFVISGHRAGRIEHCAVLEAVGHEQTAAGSLEWRTTSEIAAHSIIPPAIRPLLTEALARVEAYNSGDLPARFVQPGWLGEVMAWVNEPLRSRGLEARGTWMQFKMGPDFCLLRLDTSGPCVWFKATGRPNLRELEITRELAWLRLPHVPELIAVREDWNAWLMGDAGDRFLDNDADDSCWRATGRSLAELQVASIPHAGQLAAAGCDDLRMPELRCRIDGFLGDLAFLMEKQPTTPPPRLGREDLRLIKRWFGTACEATESLGIPDTLGHSDLSPGNISASPDCAVFLDWMQGHIGHPFLSFEYLLALARRIASTNAISFDCVRREYLECWRPFCAMRQMEQAFDYVPLIAPFAYVTSWCGKPNLRDLSPELAALVRSLARRMHVAAHRLESAYRVRKPT